MKKSLFDLVVSRADQRCEYCRFPSDLSWLPFQIDHIIAEKHGGPTVEENLALSCYYCNSYKGPNIAGIDPEGDSTVAIQLFHPRKDVWSDHFAWDGPSLTGLTPIGRATVYALRINEPDSLDVRRLLLESGDSF